MQHLRIRNILSANHIGETLEVRGWVRTRRDSKNDFSFLEINDGSCLANIQVIADKSLENFLTEIRKLTAGCAVKVRGEIKESPAKGQEVELLAAHIEVVGWAPAETYPLQKKRHSFEFLREIAHLRPRTNSLGAVARVRNALSFAIHKFFQDREFFLVHTPIITTSNCEGAGEMFTVTAFDLDNLPRDSGKTDFNRDFFGRRAGLTVSGQLEAEIYAMALGNVYTFGPTFRAENSNTSRHLAEFWMIEPEMAFCDLKEDIDLAEAMLKFLVRYILENCAEDLALFNQFIDKELMARLSNVVAHEFVRITYTEAVERLHKSGRTFDYKVEWGIDLQSEHERYLTEEVFKCPVVIIDYPKSIKPFYMRVNDDNRTVAAMDILFPGIGEIIGGSQREERLDILEKRMDELNLSKEEYDWYLDLRRYGSAPHAGFGLGFERMVQFVTGMKNIREVIPFPRTPGSARF
ncbi:MAG: asparagine--tRNA ligase [Proteobacteria bacterium]|nr:asparagine--tRNA ligase [Pseudomonadota bacterium]MBU1709569.1 asparagine--tRNA ligase [Pseudomonadota bacterium]